MAFEVGGNVHSFEVRKLDRSRKLLKELGLERKRHRRLEVNLDTGRIRISSIKNEDKRSEYPIDEIRSVERLQATTCVRLIVHSGKQFIFKFASKAGLEMFCDLLSTLRDGIPLQDVGRFPTPELEDAEHIGADLDDEIDEIEPRSEMSIMHYLHLRSEKLQRTTTERLLGRVDTCTVFCTTFNMGNAKPPPREKLMQWIPTQCSDTDILTCKGFEIYAISVQERSYDVDMGTSREHWRDNLASLFPTETYTCITHIDSWDRSLSIYVRNELENRVQGLQADSVNVGVGGVGGNKGAIGVKFVLYDTTFCFVNSHLAAHQYEIAKRNSDFSEIVRMLKLKDSHHGDLMTSAFHHVVWMGDLNYRISLERTLCLDLIQAEQWNDLYSMDQLTAERASGRVFCGFEEGSLVYAPTYKMVRGDAFDDGGRRVYSDERSRVPAWTDRILYKSLKGVSAALKEYGASSFITTSDHTPVHAVLECSLTHISGMKSVKALLQMTQLEDNIYIRFKEIRAKLLRALDSLPNGDMQLVFDPKILVDHKPVKISSKKDPSAAMWTEYELAPLCTMENQFEVLAKKHLQLTVKIKENGPGKKQDFIASTIVWLGEAADERGYISFSEPLLRMGVKVGMVEGAFHLSQRYGPDGPWGPEGLEKAVQ